MSRVLVKDEADLSKLQGSLHTARRQCLQVQPPCIPICPSSSAALWLFCARLWSGILQSLASRNSGKAEPTIERLLHKSTVRHTTEGMQFHLSSK